MTDMHRFAHAHTLKSVMMLVLLCRIKQAESTTFKLGYRLLNSVEINTEIVSSWESCVDACRARKGCLSIEIQRRFRLCRLSSSDQLTAGTTLIQSPGTFYAEKQDWTETTIDDKCHGLCSDTERCQKDGEIKCVISECEKPHLLDNNSLILGSQLSVGSRIRHVCSNKAFSAESICEADGKWSLQQFSCPKACPDEWEQFKESCYLFLDHFSAFENAENFCQSLQARLVQVESSEENTFVKNYLSNLPMADYWIGMTDSDEEGTWKWYGTNIEVQFLDWYPNEAAFNINENCAVFGDTIGYMWADVKCNSGRKVVCEIDNSG